MGHKFARIVLNCLAPHKSHLLYVHGVILNNTEYTHMLYIYVLYVHTMQHIYIYVHYDTIQIQQQYSRPVTSANDLTSKQQYITGQSRKVLWDPLTEHVLVNRE